MKEDLIEINLEFLNEIINHIPDALVLVDAKMDIKFSNQLFRKMFFYGEEMSPSGVLGKVMSCSRLSHKEAESQTNINCSICKLRISVKDAIKFQASQNPDTIVLQIKEKDNEVLRLIQFQTNYLKYKDQDLVLVKFNDMTEFGEETVQLISNYKKNI